MQETCNALGWQCEFEFRITLGHGQSGILDLIASDRDTFLHFVRLGASKMLWTRAASQRKEYRGIHRGIHKRATLRVPNRPALPEYDRGILRSVLAGAIYTQHVLFRTAQAGHPVCPYCWDAEEDTTHLFWTCRMWRPIRDAHLSQHEQTLAANLPPATKRTGVFITTPLQSAAMAASIDAQRAGANRALPIHPCQYTSTNAMN